MKCASRLVLLLCALFAPVATAQRITVVSVLDGGSDVVGVGLYDPTWARDVVRHMEPDRVESATFPQRVLLRFSVSELDPATTIFAAQLQLTVTDPTTDTVDAYPVLVPWDFSTATWEQRLPGVPWSVPGLGAGLDRAPTPMFSVPAATTGLKVIDLEDAGLEVVRGWVSNSATNWGWLLQSRFDDGDPMTLVDVVGSPAAARPRLELLTDAGWVAFQREVTGDGGYLEGNDAPIAGAPPSGINARGYPLGVVGARARSVLRFDVSVVPPGARVVSAKLQLFPTSRQIDAQSFSVQALLAPFDPLVATSLRRTADAGWQSSDVDPVEVAVGTVPARPTAAIFVPLGSSLVQQWVDVPALNAGLQLSGQAGVTLLFAAPDDVDPQRRPQLMVEWFPPELGVDAGLDAGVEPDGGSAPGERNLGVGCSCSESPLVLGLVLLAAWLRSRQRTPAA